MEKVILYHFEGPNIKVTMELYFNEMGQLIFDGYDIGKSVKELMGDSDYEYSYTIEPGQIHLLYKIFGLGNGDKTALLMKLKEKFSCNEAYSMFGEFLKENNIKFNSFSWR